MNTRATTLDPAARRADRAVEPPVAILVLGGRVLRAARASPPLERRIAAAVEASSRWPDALLIACGGRRWEGAIEADVIARGLVARGVERERVVRELTSLCTRENLLEARRLLRRTTAREEPIAIVTCDWHLPRALSIATAIGLASVGVPAKSPRASAWIRLARAVHERIVLPIDVRLARLRR